MSLLRDALKRAEELKRAQYQAPTAETVDHGAQASTESAAAPSKPEPASTSTKPDLELAPLTPLTPLSQAESTAPMLRSSDFRNDASERSTPSRTKDHTVTTPRERSVPGVMTGALRPATEALMRRDALNLSLALAAQEIEELNTSNGGGVGAKPHAEALANAPPTVAQAIPAVIAKTAAPANRPPTPAPKAKAASESIGELEKFADRDAVKRMMAQRIAAEDEAMQNRRTRTFALGGSAVLVLVALGGWYVWKETQRFQGPVAGVSLRLPQNPGANINGVKPLQPPSAQTASPQAAQSASTTALEPINPNIGQLPRPAVVTAKPNTDAAVIPPMLSTPPSSTLTPNLALNAPLAAARITPRPATVVNVAPRAVASDTEISNTNDSGTEAPLVATVKISAADKSTKSNPRSNIQSTPSTSAPRLVTTSNKSAAPPSAVLLAGYSALLAGNAARALANYSEAAQATPDNIDAHLGLAVSAAKVNELAIARKAFARVLELDPRNGQASAGLLLLSGGTGNAENAPPDEAANNMASFARQERELKKLLQTAPQSAPLNFALGNLYANQKRWTDAQQAFFDAFAVEPYNADFAYNLAVSLDQLQQAKLAARYYETALKLKTDGRGGQFLSSQASARAAELTAQLLPQPAAIGDAK